MENKNTPQQPEELFGLPEHPEDIPQDMPQFDPLDFGQDAAPQEDIPMESLFEAVPETTPEEEAFLTELLGQEDAPAAELPGDAPQVDFADFDIPMEDAPQESFGMVYPPEDPEDYGFDGAAEPEMPDSTVYPADPVFYGETAADAQPDVSYGGADSLEPAFEEQPISSAFDDTVPFSDMSESGSDSDTPGEEAPAPKTPVRKGRPKRKKGDGLLGIPHLLTSLIWLAIVVSIGVSLGRMLWVCAADVLAFGREEKEVVVTIGSNDTIDEIAEILRDKGLIRYPGVFKLYASIAVDEGEIAPGTYTLNTILDYHALVGQMSHSSSSRAVVEDVLIPEGYNCRQIFELLEQNGICTVAELEEYTANGEFQEFWFLEGVERGDKYCLEGFLFPDTYDFYAGSTPREALGKMLLGFEARFTEEMRNQLPALNERLSGMMRKNGCSQEFIDANQLDLYDLLIVASLIEEETSSSSESPTIASVIYNRLTQDQAYERYLGIDAAIIYATGDAENIDTSIDSPYNTYINAGLTPGPISNPGLSSINAALDFEDTDYYYYVLNPSTGVHQFSKTYEEHQKWVEEFRNASAEE